MEISRSTRLILTRRALFEREIKYMTTDMDEKVALITGASSGIGLGTAIQLAERGAEVLMVCRDPVRGQFMRKKVEEYASGPTPILLLADLSSQTDIHALASQVRSRISRIDVLVNSAGAIFTRRELTPEGIERTLAINHLAPFLLTRLLLGLVEAAPAGRIVNIACKFHSGSLDFSNLQGERSYNLLAAYRRSKLLNILFTYELARRLTGSTITVNSVSPGLTATRFGNSLTGLPTLLPMLVRQIPFLLSWPEQGACGPVYVASSPDLTGVSGRFFLRCRETRTKPITYDPEVAARAWQISEALCAQSVSEMATVE
jgi:NAD(P)-dependent dehydrogenase (short-subunit alcohol dehydrogenase family)